LRPSRNYQTVSEGKFSESGLPELGLLGNSADIKRVGAVGDPVHSYRLQDILGDEKWVRRTGDPIVNVKADRGGLGPWRLQ
jgi:hypothetical protein